MTKQDMIRSISVLVVICIVISGALALVNSLTAPIIEEANSMRENASRQALLPDAVSFENVQHADMPASVTGAYQGVDANGKVIGYVFTAGHKGFDGTVVVMTAIRPNATIERVATIDVTSETKTLGGLAAEASYTDQYIGRDRSLDGVDAISRATITSEAYEACVQDSFMAFDLVKED